MTQIIVLISTLLHDPVNSFEPFSNTQRKTRFRNHPGEIIEAIDKRGEVGGGPQRPVLREGVSLKALILTTMHHSLQSTYICSTMSV